MGGSGQRRMGGSDPRMSDDGFGPPQSGGRGGRPDREVRPLARPPHREGAGGQDPAGGAGTGTATADEGFGPVERGRSPRVPRPRLRRGRATGRRLRMRTVLVVVLVAVVGFGAALMAVASVRLQRTDVQGLESAGVLRTNVLVAGGDSRADLTDEQLDEIGTNRVAGTRADSLFLISTDGTDAALLAFPRDLYVQRCDGARARINSAANDAVGGPSCLVRTVSDLTGLSVSHYVELNLASFVDVVNALGGVTMTLDEPVVDRAAGADLPAGRQELDGTQALSLVRSRRVGGDLARIQRQQQFLQAVMGKMTSPTTLLNPWRLVRTTWAGAGALTANRGFGPLGFTRLGVGLAGAGSDLQTYTVPASPRTVGGQAVLVADEPAAGELFRSFADGSALREPAQP